MPRITKEDRSKHDVVHVKTQMTKKENGTPSDWWNSAGKKDLTEKLLGTVNFLKEQNQSRYRQASLHARLYGNIPLTGVMGSGSLISSQSQLNLPLDRPTMSVITSCVDTLVSHMVQNKPRPIFLTDNGDYKERNLAKQLNQFIQGEFYQTKAYEHGEFALRDGAVLGTGVTKVLEDQNNRVALERRLGTEILVDATDAFYGKPRTKYELKLVDRGVLYQTFPKATHLVEHASQAYLDQSNDASKTISDLVLVAEAWRLPSGPKANDGIHVTVCSSGILHDSSYKKTFFPFAFLHYAPRLVGFWGQGLPERQMGTQTEINKLLITTSKAINLLGVPRIFIESGSKVVSSHINNELGTLIKYTGTKPVFEVAPCMPQEVYDQIQRLINYAYEQEGISQLSASSKKPLGLDSGAAIREHNDIQASRFASLERRYANYYVDLAYLMIDKACDIAKRDGKYQTVFPDKDGTREIKLPEVKTLEKNPFVIQCYDTSSLPKDPAGRTQKVVELMQAGIYSPQEGRRLLGFADTEQVDRLENAAEERILKILDEIVEDGKFTPPDSFMDPAQAISLCEKYYNLYVAAGLEEEKAQMLRDFRAQALSDQNKILQAKQAQAMAQMGQGVVPQAVPEAPPENELLQNVPGSLGA